MMMIVEKRRTERASEREGKRRGEEDALLQFAYHCATKKKKKKAKNNIEIYSLVTNIASLVLFFPTYQSIQRSHCYWIRPEMSISDTKKTTSTNHRNSPLLFSSLSDRQWNSFATDHVPLFETIKKTKNTNRCISQWDDEERGLGDAEDQQLSEKKDFVWSFWQCQRKPKRLTNSTIG